jgi:RNA polymerase sigma-70 factor (ECF subfamily)
MTEPELPALGWLLEARAGSDEALGQALEAYRGYLLIIAERELDADLRAKGGASDLVQETFADAHGDFAHFHGSSAGEWQAWLRALLLNRVANFARRYRHTQKRGVDREIGLSPPDSANRSNTELAGNVATPSRQVMAREQMEAIQLALESLPDDYRQVVTLRYQDQKSFEEIGVIMGRSSEAVRKLWWRALDRLQENLSPPND